MQNCKGQSFHSDNLQSEAKIRYRNVKSYITINNHCVKKIPDSDIMGQKNWIVIQSRLRKTVNFEELGFETIFKEGKAKKRSRVF